MEEFEDESFKFFFRRRFSVKTCSLGGFSQQLLIKIYSIYVVD